MKCLPLSTQATLPTSKHNGSLETRGIFKTTTVRVRHLLPPLSSSLGLLEKEQIISSFASFQVYLLEWEYFLSLPSEKGFSRGKNQKNQTWIACYSQITEVEILDANENKSNSCKRRNCVYISSPDTCNKASATLFPRANCMVFLQKELP